MGAITDDRAECDNMGNTAIAIGVSDERGAIKMSNGNCPNQSEGTARSLGLSTLE